MSKSQNYPTFEKPWFCYNGEEFQYFATEVEAKEQAVSEIRYFLDETWDEQVEQVIVGKTTLIAQKVNVVARPDDSELDEFLCDSNGHWWDENITHCCDYQPLPMKSE
jgi:hypothetical protein